MAKYILYAVIALMIAFAVDFYGIYDVPYIGSPVPDDSGFYTKGRDRMQNAADDALNGENQN